MFKPYYRQIYRRRVLEFTRRRSNLDEDGFLGPAPVLNPHPAGAEIAILIAILQLHVSLLLRELQSNRWRFAAVYNERTELRDTRMRCAEEGWREGLDGFGGGCGGREGGRDWRVCCPFMICLWLFIAGMDVKWDWGRWYKGWLNGRDT